METESGLWTEWGPVSAAQTETNRSGNRHIFDLCMESGPLLVIYEMVL